MHLLAHLSLHNLHLQTLFIIFTNTTNEVSTVVCLIQPLGLLLYITFLYPLVMRYILASRFGFEIPTFRVITDQPFTLQYPRMYNARVNHLTTFPSTENQLFEVDCPSILVSAALATWYYNSSFSEPKKVVFGFLDPKIIQ